MKTTYFISICTFLIVILGNAFCYGQNAEVNKTEMAKLASLQGKWSGSGWYQSPDQKRHQVNQTEDIYSKLDGQVLVINGLGKDPETGEEVFEAFAVIRYDQKKGQYEFSSYTKEGHHTLASAKFEGDDLVWWFDTSKGGTIKYKIDFTENTWIEDGHFSPDGEKWYPFFHMELKKVQ